MRKPAAASCCERPKPVELKRSKFGEDEDDLIIKLHALLGNRWSLIAGRLPGRTDSEVKNYWNKHLKRKLLQMGIDPSNHRLARFATPKPIDPDRKISCSPIAHHEHKTQSNGAESKTTLTMSRALPDINLDLTIGPPLNYGSLVQI